MRKLGEQWVEEINGKYHMVKAVKQTNKCSGCVFCTSIWCADHNQSERDFDCMTMIIKDLGILNEDGCLPSSWGEYPTIEAPSEEGEAWCIYAFLAKDGSVIKKECAWGETEQQAIDAWNRRV